MNGLARIGFEGIGMVWLALLGMDGSRSAMFGRFGLDRLGLAEIGMVRLARQ